MNRKVKLVLAPPLEGGRFEEQDTSRVIARS